MYTEIWLQFSITFLFYKQVILVHNDSCIQQTAKDFWLIRSTSNNAKKTIESLLADYLIANLV